MTLFKFINENTLEKYKGGFIVLDNMIHTNPSEETIKAAGYKEIRYADDPEINFDKQYIAVTYKEHKNYIEEIKIIKDIEVDNIDKE